MCDEAKAVFRKVGIPERHIDQLDERHHASGLPIPALAYLYRHAEAYTERYGTSVMTALDYYIDWQTRKPRRLVRN